MFDIITVGSATLDVFVDTGKNMFRPCPDCPSHVKVPFGSKVLIKGLHFFTGGGGTNTAVGFARLGFRVGWIGKIGDDETGHIILSELHKEHVNTGLCAFEIGGVSGYTVILDAKGHDRTVLAYKGCNDDLTTKDMKPTRIKTSWLYCSSQLRASAKTMLEFITHSKKTNMKVAFNPSSYMITTERKTVQKILRSTYALIFNLEEARLLAGSGTIPHILKRIHSIGPSVIVITDGKNGAYASDGSSMWHCKAPAVKVVEATGAGDAFATGFVSGLMKSKPLTTCLKQGMAEAGGVIQYIGSKNILMSSSELTKAVLKIPNHNLSRIK